MKLYFKKCYFSNPFFVYIVVTLIAVENKDVCIITVYTVTDRT